MLGRVACRPSWIRNVLLFDFLAPAIRSHQYASASSRPANVNGSLMSLQTTRNGVSLFNGLDSATTDSDVTFFNECILRLRRALSIRDVERVWACWSQLKDRNLLKLLGPQLQSHSLQISKLCPRTAEASQMKELKIIETIALYSAGRGAVTALVACMTAYLQAGNSHAVMDLFDSYLNELHHSRGHLSPSDGLPAEGQGEEDLEDFTLEPSSGASTKVPVHNTLLLALITAFAIDNAFHAALRAFLRFPRQLPRGLVEQFLSQFPDASLRSTVGSYVQRLHIVRYLSQPRLLTHRTSLLASNLDDTGLQKLYNQIIDGLRGEEAYITVHPAELTERTPVAVEEINWAAFLTAFLKCDRRDLGVALWNDMSKFGVKPTAISWTALLDGYDSMKTPEDAEKAWNVMIAQGTEPSAMTYRAIISAFFNAHEPAGAIRYFQLFQQRLSEGWEADRADCIAVYNTVLHGLLSNGRSGDAHALLQRLREKGPKPDIVSFNTVLQYHGRRGEFRLVSRILDQMSEDGLTGDVYTFSTVLSSLLKIGRTDATGLILNLMRKQNIEPNAAIFSAIIDHQVQEGTEQGLNAGMELLRRMERSPEARPNDVTYTGILAGLHRRQWANATFAHECKRYILGRMKERGIRFNRTVYHILLKACLENPAPEGIQEAMGYYEEMVKKKVSLNYDTWYVLLRGVIGREAWDVADELVRDLKRQMIPRGSLENLVSRVRKRTAWKRRLGPNVYF